MFKKCNDASDPRSQPILSAANYLLFGVNQSLYICYYRERPKFLTISKRKSKKSWFCLYTLFVTSQKRRSSIIALTASRCACLLTGPFENARQGSSGCVRFPSSGSILHLSTLTEVKVVSEQSPAFLRSLPQSFRSFCLACYLESVKTKRSLLETEGIL